MPFIFGTDGRVYSEKGHMNGGHEGILDDVASILADAGCIANVKKSLLRTNREAV